MAINQALLEMVESGAEFGAFHDEERISLQRFLNSTMEKPRLDQSMACNLAILKKISADDAGEFLEEVYKKEYGGAIVYKKQRDHTAHTLYNYLLGWMILTRSKTLSEQMKVHLHKRGLLNSVTDTRFPKVFGAIWIYVSILHDIGYIFEGGSDSEKVNLKSNASVKHATELMVSYFDSIFWEYVRIDCGADSGRVRAGIGLRQPAMRAKTLAKVSQNLRNLGPLQSLYRSLKADPRFSGRDKQSANKHLHSDAFRLWEQNYRFYESESMANRIALLESEYEKLIEPGFNGNIKLLNHGVCSGLIQAHFLTYFYLLHFLLKENADVLEREAIVGLAARRYRFRDGIDAYQWWAGFVWATAATAMHDLSDALGRSGQKLAVEDDPLAFLGILVDEIQHWDRYAVHRFANDRVPVESQDFDVELGADGLSIRYVGQQKLDIADSLDARLAEWRTIVPLTEPGP